MYKFFLLFCVAAAAASLQACPGTTVSTVTTSSTTTSISYDDEADESGFLSASDRSIIRKTWYQARKDGDVAPQILYRFLKAHPEYQKKFRTFANVPQDELLGNGYFLAQAYTILAGLNVVIQSMGSRELLANQVKNLGGAHFERGIVPVMFDEFGAISVEVLGEELGSSFTTEARQAWTNGFRALIAGLTRSLKNPNELLDPQTKLSKRIIKDVQSSWEAVRGERYVFVSAIFRKLFAETPRTLRHFRSFSSVAADQLEENAAFKKQVHLVADRLDTIVSALDDKLQILGNINYMRYSHEERSISRQTFEDFARLLLDLLSSRGVSADNLDSWRFALNVLVDGITPKKI